MCPRTSQKLSTGHGGPGQGGEHASFPGRKERRQLGCSRKDTASVSSKSHSGVWTGSEAAAGLAGVEEMPSEGFTQAGATSAAGRAELSKQQTNERRG